MAQLNPAITSFLQNTTATGTYYVSGNSTAQSNGILVNCQLVEYSTTGVYVHTTGIPAYPTGPFLDGNPSLATNQSAIFKIPFAPTQNTGTATATTGGNIGIFINGVALFDYRDGVAWNATTNALCGGPGNPPCPGGPQATQAWNRDAVRAERPGFDCSKAHPAQGNYHHHQNPSSSVVFSHLYNKNITYYVRNNKTRTTIVDALKKGRPREGNRKDPVLVLHGMLSDFQIKAKAIEEQSKIVEESASKLNISSPFKAVKAHRHLAKEAAKTSEKLLDEMLKESRIHLEPLLEKVQKIKREADRAKELREEIGHVVGLGGRIMNKSITPEVAARARGIGDSIMPTTRPRSPITPPRIPEKPTSSLKR